MQISNEYSHCHWFLSRGLDSFIQQQFSKPVFYDNCRNSRAYWPTDAWCIVVDTSFDPGPVEHFVVFLFVLIL